MNAANHPSPSNHWFDALVHAAQAALRPTPLEPVAPVPKTNDALFLTQPTPNSQPTTKEGGLPGISQTSSPLVLPASLPARMLLLSADSGITTTMAMLRDLQARNYRGDVVLLHVCRNPAELHQAGALQSAADNYPELSLLVHFDEHAGPFSPEALSLAVPDVHERSTWMCGPSGFIEMVQAYWRKHGLTLPLHSGSCSNTIPVM